MGKVDLAVRREGTFLRLYAVKRLHPHLREDADVRAMFLDEARIAGLIRHPNVVSVLDVGEDEEGPFLVMDYVEGVSVGVVVQRALESRSLVPLEVCLRIGIHAAEGLHAAHDLVGSDGAPLSLVHRDVSPHNILVGFDGVARVTDFGIAKALGQMAKTSTGILKGKLGYMAPEQLQFRSPDRRTDLFSLGIVLFELLTAQRLYPGKLGEESARRILEEPPPDLADYRDDAPPELVGLLFKMLAKTPAGRPTDARSVARALESILADVAAAGDAIETSEYLAREFAEERGKLIDEVASAVHAIDSMPPPSVTPAAAAPGDVAPARRRASSSLVAIAMLAVVVLAGGAAIWWLLSPPRSSPATGAAAPAPRTRVSPLEIARPPEPRAASAEAAPPQPAASRGVPESAGNAGDPDEATDSHRAARRRRAQRGARHGPRAAGTADERSNENMRLWDWQ